MNTINWTNPVESTDIEISLLIEYLIAKSR